MKALFFHWHNYEILKGAWSDFPDFSFELFEIFISKESIYVKFYNWNMFHLEDIVKNMTTWLP